MSQSPSQFDVSSLNGALDIIGIPRTSLPTLEDRCNIATKRELERIVKDITHPNQNVLTKPNTSHGYNLRSKLGSVTILKSETQRHANSFIAIESCKTPLMICYFYLLTYLLFFSTFFLLE